MKWVIEVNRDRNMKTHRILHLGYVCIAGFLRVATLVVSRLHNVLVCLFYSKLAFNIPKEDVIRNNHRLFLNK